ncbi:IPT/TIG domain-containing protein [Dysgonomonadaceae bacterium zrk40]|nr:IPT/TIG domain-containing protein [Dysgonomonadaceae bacterium zrk40]
MKYRKLLIPIFALLTILLMITCESPEPEMYGGAIITEISPSEGYVNDVITIKGENFALNAEDNIVRFGEHIALVQNSSTTELKVLVPNGTGTVNVTVTRDLITSEGVPFKFLIPTLTLSSITPDKGAVGDEIILTGDNFNENPFNNLVQFNDVVATVKSAEKNKLNVIVPEGKGSVNVTVAVGRNKTGALKFEYVVTKTTLTAIIPASAFPGDTVRLEGTFKSPTGENKVTFGNNEANIVSSSNEELKVIVPPGSGAANVTVTSYDDVSESVQFNYATVALHSLSKNDAEFYERITISGNGFDPEISNNKVFFGNNEGQVIDATQTSLTVSVPAFADENSDVMVTVKVGDGISNTLPFHLLRYYTEVIAGNGVLGSSLTPVNAMEAAFTQPVNLALDKNGNIYIAESGGGTVRKLTPDGKVIFLAGQYKIYGSNDGIGADATFKYPYDLVVGNDDNIYVADVTNKLIRKISPDGIVTTIAGNVTSTSAKDGVGTEGTFNQPYSITLDNDGNLIVGDRYAIRKITLPDHIVSTIAGDDLNAAIANSVSSFNSPRGLAVGPDGTIYVCDALNNCIKKINPDKTVVRIAGPADRTKIGHVDGPGDQALFFNPQGLSLAPDGNLFVSDGTNKQNYYLRKIHPDGYVSSVMGTGAITPFVEKGWGTEVPYRGWGVAIDSDGNIYIPDQEHLRIRKLYLK